MQAGAQIFESRYQIVEASDGEKALACIASYENNKIGTAIISLTLSEPDGFQILEMLQRERAVWNIPLIATSWDGTSEKALDMRQMNSAQAPYGSRPGKARHESHEVGVRTGAC